MSICLIILNCFKYEHKRQQQRSTWLKDFPYELWFHIRGVHGQAQDYVIDKEEHIIYVKTRDNYDSLTQKTYLALKAVRESFPTVTHILKTDDDENCNVSKLVESMDEIMAYDYGGGYLTLYKTDKLSTYHYHSSIKKEPALVKAAYYFIGRFYFLSAKAADIVLSKKKAIWRLMFEDNAIGYALMNELPLERYKKFPDKQIFMEFE